MPLIIYITLAVLLAVSCTNDTDCCDNATTANQLYKQARSAFDAEDADSAFSLLLKAEAYARTMTLLAVIMAVIAIGTGCTVWLAKRAKKAKIAELEALRLAEAARTGEEEMRILNQDLQKRYYAHLYAIILPILNAKRTKTGYIDLNEKEWKLIEENTDLVLPKFTRKLRKNHPTLGDDDIRFCCLVAMQVPNPVIANVYGIAPSSVSVRKQRMKKKLDEAIANETLENYLSKYSL